MKIFIKVTYSIVVLFLLLSCESDSSDVFEYSIKPIRDYTSQYNEDVVKIENYLKTYSVSVTNNSRFTDDQNTIFATVPSLEHL